MTKKKNNTNNAIDFSDLMKLVEHRSIRRGKRTKSWKRWNKLNAPPPNIYPSVCELYEQVLKEKDNYVQL